jgi:Ni/Fe-hydrogenase b-type cytochrome subunit
MHLRALQQATEGPATGREGAMGGRTLVYRHALLVRITHWINVLCLTVLLASGLQIFNAHPALYWGDRSDFSQPVLALDAVQQGDAIKGVTRIGGASFDTTGVLGASEENGETVARGFPSWITLPSYQDLATGRAWHFFFAWVLVLNGLVYLAAGFARGHFRRDLLPNRTQLRHIGGTVRDHLLLRFPKGEEARHYNVLQKLTYLGVIFVVLPILVLAGLAMSPGIDAIAPWLPAAFGGRQSARTIHFICAWTLVLFVLVHIVMVLVSGVFNNLRAMITGRYAIAAEPAPEGK